jgi:hypothetical protein
MPDFEFKVLSIEPETYAVSPTLLVQLAITNKIENDLVLSINLLTEFHFNSPAKSLYWTSVSAVVPRFIGNTKTIIRLPCSEDSDLQIEKYLLTVRPKVTEGNLVDIRVTCKKCRSERERRVAREHLLSERHRLTEEPCEVCGSLEYEVNERELEEKTPAGHSEEPQIPFKLVFYGSAIYQTFDSQIFNFFPFPQLPPKQAEFKLPASVWKTMMENHYGQSRWLRVREELFLKLSKYVETNRLASYDEALSRLIEEALKR